MCLSALIVGGIAAGVGLYEQKQGMDDARAAQNKITQDSIQAENLRQQQMMLDNRRKQREAIRNFVTAQATGTSNAASAGALLSSSYEGGQAQAFGHFGTNIYDQAANTQIGNRMFDVNRQKAVDENSLGQARADINEGQGLFSVGSAFVSNYKQAGAIGETLFGAKSSQAISGSESK